MEYANDLLKQLLAAQVELQLALALIGVGLVLKHALRRFPNDWIPVVMLAGGAAAYFFVGDRGKAPHTMRNPEVWLVLIGFIIGAAAWFVHEKVLRHVEDWVQRRLERLFPPKDGTGNPS